MFAIAAQKEIRTRPAPPALGGWVGESATRGRRKCAPSENSALTPLLRCAPGNLGNARNVVRKNEKGSMMNEYNLVYRGPQFLDVDINPVTYCDDFFQAQLNLESDLFYELRKKNDIKPYKINQSSSEELFKIKDFFNQNKNTFLFLFNKNELIGSILFLNNYIQALSINRKYQRLGYGTKLTKFVINKILSSNNQQVTLKVMEGNIPALDLYKKLGFKIVG